MGYVSCFIHNFKCSERYYCWKMLLGIRFILILIGKIEFYFKSIAETSTICQNLW